MQDIGPAEPKANSQEPASRLFESARYPTLPPYLLTGHTRQHTATSGDHFHLAQKAAPAAKQFMCVTVLARSAKKNQGQGHSSTWIAQYFAPLSTTWLSRTLCAHRMLVPLAKSDVLLGERRGLA